MSEGSYTEEHSGSCPCGKKFSIVRDEDKKPDLIHEMPPCQDFVNRDPDEYLKWIRQGGKN